MVMGDGDFDIDYLLEMSKVSRAQSLLETRKLTERLGEYCSPGVMDRLKRQMAGEACWWRHAEFPGLVFRERSVLAGDPAWAKEEEAPEKWLVDVLVSNPRPHQLRVRYVGVWCTYWINQIHVAEVWGMPDMPGSYSPAAAFSEEVGNDALALAARLYDLGVIKDYLKPEPTDPTRTEIWLLKLRDMCAGSS